MEDLILEASRTDSRREELPGGTVGHGTPENVTHGTKILFPNPTPMFESLKIWEACMGPAYHFRGSHVLGGSLESPLIVCVFGCWLYFLIIRWGKKLQSGNSSNFF